jgi:MoxR-like ATPase
MKIMSNENSWWIYEGSKKTNTEKLEKRKNKPLWRDKDKKTHNASVYEILDDKIKDAVNAAIYLRRPLLVTGDPGIGKSSLAKSIAFELTGKDTLDWHITSKSTLQDALYFYDALARLQDIQMQKLKNIDIEADIGKYIKLGALGEAFISKETRVVLIDEIDKSDIDLPNDLLHVFEEQEFVIDEVKRTKEEVELEDGSTIPSDGRVVSIKDFPIVIMTSNGEREFPPAFLRRCICINLELPKDKKRFFENMIKGHFTEETQNNEQIDKTIEKFLTPRHQIILS